MMPLVPLDLPLEALELVLDHFEVIAHPILWRLFVHLAFERVVTPCSTGHLSVFVVTCPHELRGSDVLDCRGLLWKLDLLAAVFGGNHLPGANQLVFGFPILVRLSR